MSSRKPPTLTDVAREAGVSPFTVSVVLNGARSNTRVSPATRQRILDSAAQLRYQANAQARSLARQRTNTLGVLFDVVDSTAAIGNPYASGILQGIVRQARSSGYDVLIYTEPWQDATHSAARFRDRRTDGVIVVAPRTGSDLMSGLQATGIPLCAVSAAPLLCTVADAVLSVDVDNQQGIREAVAHLLALGHRHIAHLTGDLDVYSAVARQEAFEESLAAAGIAVPEAFIVSGHYDGSQVAEILPGLLSLPQPPTALVAGNDNIALAVLRAARAQGVEVPEQLSVIGFDDNAASAQVTPPLTTLRQPLAEIGAAAAAALIGRIEEKEEDSREPLSSPLTLLPPQLIVRASTAAVPLSPRVKRGMEGMNNEVVNASTV